MTIRKRWLITGGCGFIGTNLIQNLVSKGNHFIRIVDNLSVGTLEDLAKICKFTERSPRSLSLETKPSVLSHDPRYHSSLLTPDSLLNSRVELIIADILDFNLALKATQGMDVIVHLAANTGVDPSVKNPRQDMEVNVFGTLNYLEAARENRVSTFIFASSGAPIGECEPPIHEEMAPHPVSPYGASKLAGEAYCSAYYRTYDINTVVLRFANVYGPGSNHKNSVVAKFIRQAIHGETLEIYGDGKQARDFVYIDDLIQTILLAATKDGIGGEIFQIATNTETTVIGLVDTLLPILADSGFNDIDVRHAKPRLGDVRRNFSDTSKAEKILGWKAKADLSDGLRRTVERFTKDWQ